MWVIEEQYEQLKNDYFKDYEILGRDYIFNGKYTKTIDGNYVLIINGEPITLTREETIEKGYLQMGLYIEKEFRIYDTEMIKPMMNSGYTIYLPKEFEGNMYTSFRINDYTGEVIVEINECIPSILDKFSDQEIQNENKTLIKERNP